MSYNQKKNLHVSHFPRNIPSPPHAPRYDVHSTARRCSFQAAGAASCKARSKRCGQPKLGAGPAWCGRFCPGVFMGNPETRKPPAKIGDLPGKNDDLPRTNGDLVDLPWKHAKIWGKFVGTPIPKMIYGNPGKGGFINEGPSHIRICLRFHETGTGIDQWYKPAILLDLIGMYSDISRSICETFAA